MRTIISFILVISLPLVMVGCASMPKEEDLQQLSRAQLSELLPGKTVTRSADYGRFASYFKDGSTGVGKAWGTWGSEGGTYKYTINQDGEICSTWSGEHDWTKHKFCSLYFTDQEGMYYTKSTEDTWKPKRIGKFRRYEIIEGDKYELVKN